ncbi:hypothetical protein BC826DRAFT_967855 [Russula brevipes]|nr:hypothetical protein BC826DRAFT_967855 [Russula brevipes]
MTRGHRSGHQDTGPSHGALNSGPGPLGDMTASFQGGSPSLRPWVASPGGSHHPDHAQLQPLSRLTLGLRPQTIRALQMSVLNFGHTPSVTRQPTEEAHPQNHGLQPCPGWPTALQSSAFAQATTVRNAVPQTFAVKLGIVPQAAGAQCNANSSEHRAASATQMAASTALPAQHKRQQVLRCQRNANSSKHRAGSTAQTVASTALAVQCKWQRAPHWQCNANGSEHRAGSATQTVASTALAVQREQWQAPRRQLNANGSEHRAASATQTAASARCQCNTNGERCLPVQCKQ